MHTRRYAGEAWQFGAATLIPGISLITFIKLNINLEERKTHTRERDGHMVLGNAVYLILKGLVFSFE